jgi:ribosome-associated heat shock protein Hsp15
MTWMADRDRAASGKIPYRIALTPTDPTMPHPKDPETSPRPRIDKWLWAARFFKTRGLAQDAVEGGKVRLNGDRVKSSKEVKVGDTLEIQVGELSWTVSVLGLSDRRGPAPVARLLYSEAPESQAAREKRMETRQWVADPGSAIKGRPTKRDRRLIHRFKDQG